MALHALECLGPPIRIVGGGVRLGAVTHKLCEQVRNLHIDVGASGSEPDRADYRTDLVVSLVRVATRPALDRALGILERLNGEGRLTVRRQQWIPMLRQMPSEAGKSG